MNTKVSYPEDKDQPDSICTLQIAKKDVDLILECLLFSSSVNIGADWTEEDFLNMLKLAKKIKNDFNKDLKLSNLILYKEENYEDSWTEELRKEFGKNIQQEVELEKA